MVQFIGVFLLSALLLFLKVNTDYIYYKLTFIPVLISAGLFVVNSLRLNSVLNYFSLLCIFTEWAATYGKTGIMLPLYLLFVVIDLKVGQCKQNKRFFGLDFLLAVYLVLYLLQFVLTLIGCIYAGQSFDYLKLYNSAACAYVPASLYLSYLYFSKRKVICHYIPEDIENVRGSPRGITHTARKEQSRAISFCPPKPDNSIGGLYTLPGIFPFFLVFLFFITVLKHEYLYAFHGAEGFSIHSEFIISAYFILFCFVYFLIFDCFKPKKVIPGKAYLFIMAAILYFYLPSYSVSGSWNDFNWLNFLKKEKVIPLIFGNGYKWKYLYQGSADYNLNQFPLSFFSILFLEGGLIQLSVFFIVLAVAIKSSYNNLLRLLPLILILAASCIFPVLRDPMSVIMFSFILSELTPEQSQKQLLPSYRYQLYSGKLIGAGVAAVGLILVYNFGAAAYKIAQGPRFSRLDTEFSLPKGFISALLVSEDILFYRHRGVDFSRIKKTFLETVNQGKFARGGSSISMQLAKVQYLEFDKTISRKIQQILIALYLEALKSKEQILHEYLAAVGYGPYIQGVKSASKTFFNEKPENLIREQYLKIILSIPDPVEYNASMKLSVNQLKFIDSLNRREAEFKVMLQRDIHSEESVHD